MDKSIMVLIKNRNLQMVFLAGLAFITIFCNLGTGSLITWDEAMHASIAKEMFYSGEYLSLYCNGKYWPIKTPLIFWHMAVCFKLFGISELSARIPTALYGFLSIGIAYFWGRKYFSHYAGLIAGVFVLSHLHFLGFSRIAMLDVPLGFFMAGSLLAYRMGLNKQSYFYLAGFGMGLAVMSKGVIGFFPACIIVVDVIWFKRQVLLQSWKFWMIFSRS